MKFGDKYELLESLTTGGLETFVANDKVRGERVLVHILEGDAQKPNQPTVQWVLEAFRRIAPEPAGLVLEAGRYSGTTYAYLVTKMPGEGALASWLRSYNDQGRDTQGFSTTALKQMGEPTAELGKASQLRDALSQPPRDIMPQPHSAINPPTPPKVEPQPFPTMPAIDAVPARPLTPPGEWPPLSGAVPPLVRPEPPAAPVGAFTAAFAAPKVPVETSSSINERSQAGDFTNFFQGPFRGEKSSDLPAVSIGQMEPPQKKPGEFTQMFGSPLVKEPSTPAGLNEPAGTGFTALFNTPNISSASSGTSGLPPAPLLPVVKEASPVVPAPLQEPVIAAPATPAYAVQKPVIPTVAPPPVAIPPVPMPAKEMPSPVPVSPLAGTPQATGHPIVESPEPAGPPSMYTRVISVRAAAAPPVAEPPGPSLPSFAAAAPPPMPAPPKAAAPAAPKPPKDTPAPPPVSYWPLILALTVLFFLAVLVVLYFALKH